MSEITEIPQVPWQKEKDFWTIVNKRVENGPEYSDGETIVRGFLHQESNAGIPGKEVGGAAIATNDILKIMQDELGIIVASASLNPESLNAPQLTQEDIDNRNRLPFAAEFISRPDVTPKSGDKNADLTEVLTDKDLSKSYIEYAAMLMNGSDVIFPNYWTAGVLAIRAKEYLEQLQQENKPLIITNEKGEKKVYNVWKIPKVVYCNHSLPARIDEQLSGQDNPDKQMDQRRKEFQEEVYKKADAIMVWTHAEKNMSVLAYPDIPDIGERMHVVKAPVQFDTEKAKQIRPEMRNKFFNGQIDDETLVYYYQGRFEDYKHPEILLQSFIEMYLDEKKKDPEVKPNIACLLIGGPFTDKEGNPTKVYKQMLDMIEAIPSEYKDEIKSRISMPGSQPKEAGHAAGDILVFPSIKESLGLTLVEAVLAGNLVIASKTVPTVTEANGHSGFYAADQKGFKESMKYLFEHPEQHTDLLQNLSRSAKEYTPQKTAQDIRDMFQN